MLIFSWVHAQRMRSVHEMSRKTLAEKKAEWQGRFDVVEMEHRREVAILRQDAVALRNEIARLKGQLVATAHAAGRPAPSFDL